MKSTFFLFLLVLPFGSFAQDAAGASRFMRKLSPFKETGEIVACRREWMIPNERMDSLKQEVKRLEEKLASMQEVPVDLTAVSFVQLFESEYEVRVEFDGEINEHFCVSDSDAGKQFRVFDSGEADFTEMLSLEGTYLVVKSEAYYLGNCQKLTTVKKYYVRVERVTK